MPGEWESADPRFASKTGIAGVRPLGDEATMEHPPRDKCMFSFRPKWKEELVVAGPGGAFILDLPMGVLTACLPAEATWRREAPEWARDLWPVLKDELGQWCRESHATLSIEENASVHPIAREAPTDRPGPDMGQAGRGRSFRSMVRSGRRRAG